MSGLLIFVALEEGLLSLELSPMATVGDIHSADPALANRTLLWQGEEIKSRDALLADLGICPESTLGVVSKPAYMYRDEEADMCVDLTIVDEDRMVVYNVQVYFGQIGMICKGDLTSSSEGVFTYTRELDGEIIVTVDGTSVIERVDGVELPRCIVEKITLPTDDITELKEIIDQYPHLTLEAEV